MTLLFLLVLSGCGSKCKPLMLPDIKAIDKIGKEVIVFNDDGSMNVENAQKAGNLIRRFYISDRYWNKTIIEYSILKNKIEKGKLNE